jgi:3'(2'), 5'-bisphosphate nucleotidase
MYDREKNTAIEAITQAAHLCAAVRAEMVGAESIEKVDQSPVTVADLGAQALVCAHLRAAFAQDAIVAEEDASELQKPENAASLEQVAAYVRRFKPGATPQQVCEWIDAGNDSVAERFWTLDPIDGTKGFLRNDQYAVALALVEKGRVQVGALACPALPRELDLLDQKGVLFVAVRGQGASMGPLEGGAFIPIQVADGSRTDVWRFVESVEAAHGNQALQEAIARAVGITHPPLRMDSQAKYGAVARGDAVLYLRLPSSKHPGYREKIWDHAAGTLIVEEAGGRVTDMHGRPLDLASHERMRDTRGVVVSNGAIHSAVLEALAGVEPRE